MLLYSLKQNDDGSLDFNPLKRQNLPIQIVSVYFYPANASTLGFGNCESLEGNATSDRPHSKRLVRVNVPLDPTFLSGLNAFNSFNRPVFTFLKKIGIA